jgi:hypothetical protein
MSYGVPHRGRTRTAGAHADRTGILLATGTRGTCRRPRDGLREPARHQALARQAAEWAKQPPLDGLRDALAKLLSERWDDSIAVRPVPLSGTRPSTVEHAGSAAATSTR